MMLFGKKNKKSLEEELDELRKRQEEKKLKNQLRKEVFETKKELLKESIKEKIPMGVIVAAEKIKDDNTKKKFKNINDKLKKREFFKSNIKF